MKVEYIQHMGNDITVVNAARVSFDLPPTSKLDNKSIGLIRFLAKGMKTDDWNELIDTLSNETDKTKIENILKEYRKTPTHWCYDDKTEIFTEKGWLNFDSLDTNTKVAEVYLNEMQQFKFRFVLPQKIHRTLYSGPMYLNEGPINYCVTPRHRMFVRLRGNKGYKPWEIVTSDEAFGKVKYMSTTASLETENDTSSYELGQYFGFLLGDGYRVSGKKIQIRLKKERKIHYIRGVLNSLGKSYEEKISEDGVYVFVIADSDTILHKGHEKTIGDIINPSNINYCRGVFNGLMESDGCKKHSGWEFSTSSPNLAKDVQKLAVYLGYSIGRIKDRHLDNPNHRINTRITILSMDHGIVNRSSKNRERIIDYNGYVSCVTVPSGLVLVRREGKQLVCGNTPFGHETITLRETIPIFVARQRFKHKVGFVENEVSRRYRIGNLEFFKPDMWRKAAEDKKQGSLNIPVEFLEMDGGEYTVESAYNDFLDHAEKLYDSMIKAGICPEQARMVLPQSMMTSYYVTGSLYAFSQLYNSRIRPDAQKEIQVLANKIGEIIAPLFPVSWQELTQ